MHTSVRGRDQLYIDAEFLYVHMHTSVALSLVQQTKITCTTQMNIYNSLL